MDVFYYWKNYEADLREGRIGWLRSDHAKLQAFKSRYPDAIWAFKTPRGRKGQVQLIARLVWSDHPTIKLPKLDAVSTVFYDPSHPDTVRFVGTDKPGAIEAITDLLHDALPPAAFRSNFQGENGQHGLEANFVRQLSKLASRYECATLLLSTARSDEVGAT